MRDEFFSDWLEYRRGNRERPDPADYEDDRAAELAKQKAEGDADYLRLEAFEQSL